MGRAMSTVPPKTDVAMTAPAQTVPPMMATTTVQPLEEGCCTTDPRVASQPLDKCMWATMIVAVIGALISIIGFIIGITSQFVASFCIMLAIGNLVGVAVVPCKNKGLMLFFVIFSSI